MHACSVTCFLYILGGISYTSLIFLTLWTKMTNMLKVLCMWVPSPCRVTKYEQHVSEVNLPLLDTMFLHFFLLFSLPVFPLLVITAKGSANFQNLCMYI